MICNKCGQDTPATSGICENCGAELQSAVATPEVPAGKPENFVTGIVGALIGAVIGAAAIVLLSQLGFVASISGIILAVCTMKGYELLGGKLSTKGLIVCIALMLVTPYIADRLDWALVIMESWEVSLGEAFQAVPELLEAEMIDPDVYWEALIKCYVFTAIGVVATLAGNKKAPKKK